MCSSVTTLNVKRLSPRAILPQRSSEGAVGFDLFSAETVTVPSCGQTLIATDIAVEIPQGCYGRIAPRSGLAVKHGINVGAGVIDPDYRGNVKVLLFNHGTTPYDVEQGFRIAQLIIEVVITPQIVEVETLNDTERDDNGFGSTGM